MGNKVTVFTDVQLETYQDCSFFTKKDILRMYRKFSSYAPGTIPDVMTGDQGSRLVVPRDVMEDIPELKDNPFRRRLLKVFSTDGSGDLTFDAFLDMCSVLSEGAPLDVKAAYAFKIYDHDDDQFLGRGDLEKTLKALTHHALVEEEVAFVVNKVLEETDLDDDGCLSYVEFQHVVARAPEFLSTFHIHM